MDRIAFIKVVHLKSLHNVSVKINTLYKSKSKSNWLIKLDELKLEQDIIIRVAERDPFSSLKCKSIL